MPAPGSRQLFLPGPTAHDLIDPVGVAELQRTLAEVGQTVTRAIEVIRQPIALVVEEWQRTLAALALPQTLTVVQQSFAPVQRLLRDYFRPGTLMGDAWLLRADDPTDARAAAQRLARTYLRWEPDRRSIGGQAIAVAIEIRARIEGCSRSEVVTNMLVDGLLSAARDDETPTILEGEAYYNWLFAEAVRRAELALLQAALPDGVTLTASGLYVPARTGRPALLSREDKRMVLAAIVRRLSRALEVPADRIALADAADELERLCQRPQPVRIAGRAIHLPPALSDHALSGEENARRRNERLRQWLEDVFGSRSWTRARRVFSVED